jgi:hypothetical protein
MMALDLVFRYRVLQHKCDSGQGLDLWEIDELAALEAAFAAGVDDQGGDGRKHCRSPAPTALTAIIRGLELNDRAEVTDLAPGGLRCAGIPAAYLGEVVDVVFEGVGASRSLRLKARVAWVRQAEDGTATMGLAFVGAPVQIRYSGAILRSSEMFDALPTKHAA